MTVLCAVARDANMAQYEQHALERVPDFDCAVIVTDHSRYDYPKIVEIPNGVDTRNATRNRTTNIVRC